MRVLTGSFVQMFHLIRLIRLFMKRIVLKSQVRTLKLMLFDFTLSVMMDVVTTNHKHKRTRISKTKIDQSTRVITYSCDRWIA